MKTTILGVTALALISVFAAVSQTPATPKHKVVFQMNDGENTWDSLVGHVTNLRIAFAKDGSQVEVVFFGDGLDMLLKKNTAYEERLKQLSDNGVILAACQNAMKFKNVKTEDLFPFATQVDSGVAELTRKQEAGWAYIH
jgi:intracellular sulfur oxidation DsrE/DsrF family protein